jgi:ABC-type branched-subunit amino acid transport system ATPase component
MSCHLQFAALLLMLMSLPMLEKCHAFTLTVLIFVEVVHVSVCALRSREWRESLLSKLYLLVGPWMYAVLTVVVMSAVLSSSGRLYFMNTMSEAVTLHRVLLSHALYSAATSIVATFVNTNVAVGIVHLLFAHLHSAIANMNRAVDEKDQQRIDIVLKERIHIQEYVTACVVLITFTVTTLITLLAAGDIKVILLIVGVSVISNVLFIRFPLCKVAPLQSHKGLCIQCKKHCGEKCAYVVYVKAKIVEIVSMFLYSWIPEIVCISILYLLPNSAPLIQAYMATVWMQKQAVGALMSLQHGHRLHQMVDTLLDFITSQRPYDGTGGGRVDALRFNKFEVVHKGVQIIADFTHTFAAGTVYNLVAENGFGKSMFLISISFMLDGLNIVSGSTIKPIAMYTVEWVEAMIQYVGPLGLSKRPVLDKQALLRMFPKYVMILKLTRKDADDLNMSAGQKQKWELLYILWKCKQGSVLILDEALAHMTDEIRERVIREVLTDIAKKKRLIILLVAHCNREKLIANGLHHMCFSTAENGHTLLAREQ